MKRWDKGYIRLGLIVNSSLVLGSLIRIFGPL